MVLGCDADLDWFEGMIQGEFECEIKGRLGSSPCDDKEMHILNRIVRWTPEGVTYEADQRRSGIQGTPRELDRGEARTFRSYVARANFLAQDRVDVA
jgi:hypothetical protein